MLTEPFRRLAGRPDFQRNPVKALAKRVAWRVCWLARSEPVHLRMNGGFSIAASNGAVGALIYYLGNSEPETARFIQTFLNPGMVFFDVGANIGEYTLIGARSVGPGGSVHSFEAQPNTFALLQQNCAANGLDNVTLNSCAVMDREGTVDFDVCAEPAMSAIAAPQALPKQLKTITVPAISLDGYCRRHGVWPDLVKIDVEGAEWMVFSGAAELLSRPAAPALIFECLPETYSRFGQTAETVLGFLRSRGYRIQPMQSGYNLVAVKD